jgi:hypothetical protein
MAPSSLMRFKRLSASCTNRSMVCLQAASFGGDAHGDWIDVTASWSVSDDFSTPMDNSKIFRRTGAEIRQRGKEGQ